MGPKGPLLAIDIGQTVKLYAVAALEGLCLTTPSVREGPDKSERSPFHQ